MREYIFFYEFRSIEQYTSLYYTGRHSKWSWRNLIKEIFRLLQCETYKTWNYFWKDYSTSYNTIFIRNIFKIFLETAEQTQTSKNHHDESLQASWQTIVGAGIMYLVANVNQPKHTLSPNSCKCRQWTRINWGT